jgi:hypothetical protein
MVNPSNFAPQGAKEVSVRVAQGPMLGRNFPMGGMASPMDGQGVPQGQPVQTPAQISPSNAPKGAQPVALMGSPSPLLGGQRPAQQQSMPQQMAGPMQRQMPMPMPAPMPAPAPRGPLLAASQSPDGDVYTVAIDPIDIVFPRGTKMMGYRLSIEGVGHDGRRYVADFDKEL